MLAMLLSGVGEIPPKNTQSPNVMGTFQTTFQKQNESVRSSRATVLVRFFFFNNLTQAVSFWKRETQLRKCPIRLVYGNIFLSED